MDATPRATGGHIALAFAVALSTGVGTWLPAAPPTPKLCCIAGSYRGTNTADAQPGCPAPGVEAFSMTISQAADCGTEVWGTITDAKGTTNSFHGTLSRGRGTCCLITATFSDLSRRGHLVRFTGTFCKRQNSWRAAGTFQETNSGDPCKQGGTWEITQI